MEFTLDAAKGLLEQGMAEAQSLLKNTPKVDELLVQMENTLAEIPTIGATLSQVPLMISMVKSYITGDYTEVSPKVIATLVAAFIYVVKKKDLISDNIAVLGMADDLGVLGLALKFCEPELNAYKEFRDGKKETRSADEAPEAIASAPIYDFILTTGKGEELRLSDYQGKVILVVNTATGCGFTPQYAPIEQLYKDYHDQGLEILDIPCNQFGGQAPGTDEEIHDFCTMHFNTTFPQMKKSDVNGENELPLYTYLKSQKGFEGFQEHEYKALLEKMFAEADPDWDKKPDIKWNFTKFVIDREGNVVARFEPTADMADVEACIKALL